MAQSNSQVVHDYATTLPTTDPTIARLDHIIILLPYKDLLDLPEWLSDNFTISPGGRHADNKTENKLILFHDGSYIELIAFINDDQRHKEGHWWGSKSPGIIDYALTTHASPTDHWNAMQARLASMNPTLAAKYHYAPPVAGGRKRPDGVEVKWEVTFPKDVERGELPFFCHDVTPREHRVPLSKEACTHPCGAYGVHSLAISVPASKVNDLSVVYSALLGQENVSVTEGGPGTFVIETVKTVGGAHFPKISLQPPVSERDEKIVEKEGVVLGDLVIAGISLRGDPEATQRVSQGEGRRDILLRLHHSV